MSLTQAILAETLHDEFGLSKREAKEFVDAFFEELGSAVEAGKTGSLSRVAVAPRVSPQGP